MRRTNRLKEELMGHLSAGQKLDNLLHIQCNTLYIIFCALKLFWAFPDPKFYERAKCVLWEL